jgi:hypothetical protein
MESFEDIQQKEFEHLTAELAAQIQCRHDAAVLLCSPYYVACQVGRSVHHLLRSEAQTYTRDDGRGNVREETVKYRRLELQSRYVCQQIEKLVNECAVDFVKAEGRAIASRVARQQLKTLLRRSASMKEG